MKLTHYDTLGKKTSSDLENGVLDAASERAINNGHCHSFAVALSLLTGWAVVGEHYQGRRQVSHVYCMMNDNETLVDCRHTMKAAYTWPLTMLGFPRYRHGELVLGYKFKGKGWLPLKVDELMPFAKSRVAELCAAQDIEDEVADWNSSFSIGPQREHECSELWGDE